MNATDIVAYTFAADIYCPACTRETAAYALADDGEAAFMGRPTDGDDVEGFLNRWADESGVSREDESSYDSSEFPKVVFASEVFGNAQSVWCCGGCFRLLDE